MTSPTLSKGSRIGTLLCALLFAAAVTAPASSQTSDAASVNQIDTECNAIQDAVMALHPIHVAYRSSHWDVVSDADFTVAEQTKVSITFADVYKQGSNY
jgi:hypothetical protein